MPESRNQVLVLKMLGVHDNVVCGGSRRRPLRLPAAVATSNCRCEINQAL
jgi:2-succinyl-5-enolpyruvyl-6-hydroxy-3-cyclohexene-1-carboxylate synthase